MIWRMALVAAVVAVAWFGVSLLERRRARPGLGLGPGINVVSGPGCRLCAAATSALTGAGATAIRLLDISDVDSGIRSLPTVIVLAADGTVVMQRSGRSAVSGAGEIVERARIEGVA